MWFVSQSRYDEVKAEKAELAREVTRLNSFIAWRLGGSPTHPEIDPRAEWMKTPPTAATEAREEQPEPTSAVGKAIRATGSRNPRVIANHLTRQNVEEFSKTMFAVRTEPAAAQEAAAPLTKEQRDDVAAAGDDLKQALGQ